MIRRLGLDPSRGVSSSRGARMVTSAWKKGKLGWVVLEAAPRLPGAGNMFIRHIFTAEGDSPGLGEVKHHLIRKAREVAPASNSVHRWFGAKTHRVPSKNELPRSYPFWNIYILTSSASFLSCCSCSCNFHFALTSSSKAEHSTARLFSASSFPCRVSFNLASKSSELFTT